MMNSSFFSRYISLLTTETSPSENTDDFCRAVFINRQYHRLISFIEEDCKNQKLSQQVSYWYISSLVKLKRFKEAEIYIKEKIQNADSDPKILYISGKLALKQLDFETAVDKLTKSFIKDPYFFEPLHVLLKHHLISESKLGTIIRKSKCPQEHAADINSYASVSWLMNGDSEQAFEVASRLMKENPSSDRAITTYISACLATKRQHELFVVAQRLLETAPDSYLSSFAAGCHISMSGRSDAARSLLWFTLRRMPSFAPAWLAYALTYNVDNDFRMALQVTMTALRTFPRLDLLHLWSAYFCVQTNEFAPALAHLQMCKQTGYVMNEVGCILMSLGRVREAVIAYNKALAASDVCSIYITNAATANRRAGNFEEAERLYRDVIKKEPDNANCLIGLAFTLQLTNKLEECVDLYYRAISIQPTNAFAKRMLENALFAMSTRIPELESEESVKAEESFEQKFEQFMNKL